MNMNSRNQYLAALKIEYLIANKKDKGKLLDEAEKRTKLCRKHLMVKLRVNQSLKPKPRKPRKEQYDSQVKAPLAKVWQIFDYPCGTRLETILKDEVDKLRLIGELYCSDQIAEQLKKIAPATIDRKLKHEREVLHLKKNRQPKGNSWLYQVIPVKLINDWDREKIGNCQLDFVLHSGSSAAGEFIHTLDLTEIATGWSEEEALMGRGQFKVEKALNTINSRLPFAIQEIHPDNDAGLINQAIYEWSRRNQVAFSRSRPYQKNDNAFIEQKNWTHVRKVLGYLRYDTEEELVLIASLYRNQLRLYKNYFQPTMKLIKKERIGGKVKRVYDKPKTPYQRLIASDQVKAKTKDKLTKTYQALNPAQLKREIDQSLSQLHQLYQAKHNNQNIEPMKKQTPVLVRNYMIQPNSFRLDD